MNDKPQFDMPVDNPHTPFPTHDLIELVRRLPTGDGLSKPSLERIEVILRHILQHGSSNNLLAKIVYDVLPIALKRGEKAEGLDEIALVAYENDVDAPPLLTASMFIEKMLRSLLRIERTFIQNNYFVRIWEYYSNTISEIARRNHLMSWYLTKNDLKTERWAQIPTFQDGIMISTCGRVRTFYGFPGLVYYAAALDYAHEPRNANYGAYLVVPTSFWDDDHKMHDIVGVRIEYLQQKAFENDPEFQDMFPPRPPYESGKRKLRRWVHDKSPLQRAPKWVDCRMGTWHLEWYAISSTDNHPRVNVYDTFTLPQITPYMWAQVNPDLLKVFTDMVSAQIENEQKLNDLQKQINESALP
jgi:hypothetical protein